MAQAAITTQGTDTVLGVFTDKVWLLVIVVVLLYSLGVAHGRLKETKVQERPNSKFV